MVLITEFNATNYMTGREDPYESTPSAYTAAGPDVRKTRTLESLILDVSILNKAEGF